MLCTTRRLALASWRRAFSAQPSLAHPYVFHNLRAFPFVVSPEAAQNLLSPFASAFLKKGLPRSMLCWMFPNAGFSPGVRPVRLQPVYFPGWILDVELQGQVTIKGHDRQASAQITHAYVPGSDYKVLSSATLAPYFLRHTETVPFSEDLQRQHDLDIACIPYNISPFSILDIAGHLSHAETAIAPGFRLNPSTLKANLFAAYPVLMPLYLVQYEDESQPGKPLLTFFIEASETLPAVWSEALTGKYKVVERVFDVIRSSIIKVPKQLNQSVFNMVYPKRFIEEEVRFSLEPHKNLGQFLGDYLEKAINLPGAATTLAAASAHDLDKLANDRRIRAYTPEEYDPVSEWLKLGSEMAMIQRMHETLLKARDAGKALTKISQVKRPNQPFLDKSVDSFLDKSNDTLLEKFNALQTNRLKIKPRWAKTQEDLDQKGKPPG